MNAIRLFEFFPAAKPPKRALQSFEAFDADRLQEILPPGYRWIISPKADGERAQVHVRRGRVRIFLDNGQLVDLSQIPEVVEALQRAPYSTFVLDAELVLTNTDGLLLPAQQVTALVRSGRHPIGAQVSLVVFDLLHVNSNDLSGRPYRTRLALLDRFFAKYLPVVVHEEVAGVDVSGTVPGLSSMEGAVIRAAESAYWDFDRFFKFKWAYDLDLVVEAVREEGTNRFYVMKTADGWVVGETRATHIEARPGDVLRMSVQHVSRVVRDGQEYFSWFTPDAATQKAGTLLRRVAPADVRADTLATVREVWRAIQKLEAVQNKVVKNLPANFVLQVHWWGDKLTGEAKQGKTAAEIRKLESTYKAHWDIRVQKRGAKVWFGWAFTREPWRGVPQDKVLTIPKGRAYDPKEVEKKIKQAEKEGKEIPRQLREAGPAGTESFGNLRWMRLWEETEFPPGTPGNPTTNYIARIKGLDRGKATIHRREPDFVDITFAGEKGLMRGRYFVRFVDGTYTDLKTGKKGKRQYWVLWRAKQQEITPQEIERIEREAKTGKRKVVTLPEANIT